VSTDVSEEHIASIFTVENISRSKNQCVSRWQAVLFITTAAYHLLSRWFLAQVIFFDPENGSDMFL
jgi:hypothetical protein